MKKYILILASIYILSILFLYIKQRDFIYYPSLTQEHKELEKIYNIDQLDIKTLFINRKKKKAVIYFGGNAESVEYSVANFSQILLEYDIYLVKYRGYGGSQGVPSEKNLYHDAIYIFNELEKKYSNISIIGRSLGSGIATFVASRKKVDRLILITPFDSIESVAFDNFPIFPISIILKDKFDSISRVNKIKSNTLIMVAENDKIITKKHSQNLINSFNKFQDTSNIKSIILPNTNHNSISTSNIYYKTIDNFLKK